MNELIELILHTDDALLAVVAENVNKAYFILFMIIMLETGLIFFPFLPGDGLLFSTGVIAATTELELVVLLPLLIIAAITGKLSNYYVGNSLGTGLRKSKNPIVQSFLGKYLPEAESYYQKHGHQAVIIGRFLPIIRTYIPFVAGLVKMERRLFVKNSIIGAILWISLFLLTGFFLGEIVWEKNNYGLIFLMLIGTTLIPFVWAMFRSVVLRK